MDEVGAVVVGAGVVGLAVARALALDPDILFLDEPTAGVHAHLRGEIVDLLKRANADGVTLVVVEHDMGFVETIADHVTVLHQGSVLAEGSLEQVQNDERVIEVYLGR